MPNFYKQLMNSPSRPVNNVYAFFTLHEPEFILLT